MSQPSKQKGAHNWDLTTHYHKCPACNYIFESRDDYFYRLGKYMKELDCPRCQHAFTLQKNVKPSIGPFFGEGSTPEVEWSDK